MEGAQLRRLPYAAVRRPEDDRARRAARGARLPGRGTDRRRRRGAVSRPAVPALGDAGRACGVRRRVSASTTRRSRPTRAGKRRHATLPRRVQRATRGAAPRGERRGNAPARVLDGTLVLDFTWVVAGPVATRILADQGARVVKVERRDAADFGHRRGGLSGNLNRGKQSIVLNLADPRGLELVRGLARRADVVIDNFSARVMRNWGLDYDGLLRAQAGRDRGGDVGLWLDGAEPRLRELRPDPAGAARFSVLDAAAGKRAGGLGLLLVRHAGRHDGGAGDAGRPAPPRRDRRGAAGRPRPARQPGGAARAGELRAAARTPGARSGQRLTGGRGRAARRLPVRGGRRSRRRRGRRPLARDRGARRRCVVALRAPARGRRRDLGARSRARRGSPGGARRRRSSTSASPAGAASGTRPISSSGCRRPASPRAWSRTRPT